MINHIKYMKLNAITKEALLYSGLWLGKIFICGVNDNCVCMTNTIKSIRVVINYAETVVYVELANNVNWKKWKWRSLTYDKISRWDEKLISQRFFDYKWDNTISKVYEIK